MKVLLFHIILMVLSTVYVTALPQIDETSVTDEKQFLVDNGQCIAQARSGQSAGVSNFAQDAVIGAGVGAGSSVAFGAMTGGDLGPGAAVGAVVGGLSGGGRSVYRTSQPNSQIYSQCMTKLGYKMLESD